MGIETVKRTLIILLIMTLSVLSFSCRKKESADTSSAVEKSVSSDFPEEGEKTPLELETPREESGQESDGFVMNEVYRGGEILIRAEFTPEAGQLTFNIGDDEIRAIISRLLFSEPDFADGISYTLENGELSLTYTRRTEEEIDSSWREFRSFLNDCNSEKERMVDSGSDELCVIKECDTSVGTVKAAIRPERAEITVPETLSDDSLSSFLGYVIEKYPETLEYGTLEEEGNVFTLVYSPSFTNGDASALFPTLASLFDEYFSSPAASTVEAVSASALSEEKGRTAVVEPVTEKGKRAKKFSVSASFQNTYDTRYSYVPSAFVRVDWAVRENFHVGTLSGYDWSGYVPFGVSARYYTHTVPELYIEGTFGWNIGVGERMNSGQYFTVFSIGYEFKLNDTFSLFAGADFSCIWKNSQRSLRYGISVGSRVRF